MTSVAQPYRAKITGTRHAAAGGHYLAALSAFEVLNAGGNAIDAGVAGGLALGIVESLMVGIAGVAPIIIYLADRDEVVTISGVGTFPRAATCELYQREHDGGMPPMLQTVVPAAPDAWITALERFGTMSFGEVAAHAIRFARDGFAMYALMSELIKAQQDTFRRFPSSSAI
jgi:gamma-glutamyltranspeptidase/glutathione hydrolase